MARQKTIAQSIPSLRQIVRRFSPLIRKQKWLILGSSSALLGEVAFRLLEPWPLKFVFDRVLPFTAPGGDSSAATVPSGWSPMTILALCAVAVVCIAALRAMVSYFRRVGFALAGSRVLTECRGELFSHLQRLSLSFHHKARTGDLITRVTGDIGRLKEIAITALMPLISHVITLVGMLVVMLFMDWRLAMAGLAILPLFLLSTKRIGGRIRQVARKQRQRRGEMGATAAEAIGSIRTVQALSLEKIHQKSFTAANKGSLKEGVRAKRLSARLIGTADVLIAIATAIVLWFGARLVVDGSLLPGDLIVFLAYLKNAFRPMRNLAKYSARIAKASASAERIVEILDTTPQIADRPGAVKTPRDIETLAFEDVTFGYEADHLAIEGFSLQANRGQVIALAGPSGAGKSTVLSLLLRLYDPVSGRITVNGQDIRDLTIESLRKRVAVVPQESVLFAVSIRENIAYGAPGASEEQIIEAARKARAHEFILRMPKGYDTVVGERGETISEGQRQRIAIARAAVRAAPILVLDEPTSSLDNENNRLVRDALAELSQDRICFIIAHDLSTVQSDNVVYFLDRGRIAECGTHEELLRRGGRYAAMYALQSDPADAAEFGTAHALGG